ncbi:hypothetical protein [Niallia endozanthoxylica]|uniref:Uncharacterized protein n=1 Tax=Niallia endozanthoxylica TaxID=2036016 RepID=A0A5J5I5E9_9BACI|nr:hypothetical protein [Niallia endozanthoxylica]KAA9030640.1 hypothetical protein F4V44_02270 [Niallia endozanthoxylica]
MNKFLKIILGVLSVIVLGVGLLVAIFLAEMKPDKEEEEKVKIQAEQYLEDYFNDNFEVYDTLYDNMGNFGFEYAAKVRDKKNDTAFFVYYDEETKQMADTYIADKWEDDLATELRPYMKENFGEASDFFVFFTNEQIGQELGIDPLHPSSYKEFEVAPTIRITVPREKNNEDETLLNEFITYLKSEEILQHGSVIMEYIAEDGVILDDEWGKEF